MTFLGGKQDIIKGLKELNKNYVSDETFRQLYGSTSLAEQQAVASLDYDYAQALNEAYAANMQSQNAIQGSALGQGYKQELMAQNQDAIVSAFEEYRNNYLSNLQSVTSQYDQARKSIYDAYAEQEKALGIEAENIQQYMDEYYNYANWLSDKADFSQSGLYQLIDPNTGALKSFQDLFYVDEKTGELSDESKRALYTLSRYNDEKVDPTGRPRYSFSEYLASENRELGEWATATQNGIEHYNNELFNELFGIDYNSVKDKGWSMGNTFGGVEEQLAQWKADPNAILTFDENSIEKTDKYGMDGDASKNALKANDWTIGKPYTIDDFEKNLGSEIVKGQAGYVGGKKSSIAENAIKEAREGTLKDGTIIDVNYGKGEKFYIYKGGQFYELNSSYVNRHIAQNVEKHNSGSKSNNYAWSKSTYTVDGRDVKVDDYTSYTPDELLNDANNWLHYLPGAQSDAVLKEAVQMAKDGKLQNGIFINLRLESGTPVYVYYANGKFYETSTGNKK